MMYLNLLGNHEDVPQVVDRLTQIGFPHQLVSPYPTRRTEEASHWADTLIAGRPDLAPLRLLFGLSRMSYLTGIDIRSELRRGTRYDGVVTCSTRLAFQMELFRGRTLSDLPSDLRAGDCYTIVRENAALKVEPEFYVVSVPTFLRLSLFWRAHPLLAKDDHVIWDQKLVDEKDLPQFMWGKWLLMNGLEPRDI